MSSYKHPTRSVMGRLDKLVRSGQILDASRRQKNQQKSPRSSVGHRRERGQGQAESFGLSSWRLGKLQAEQFGGRSGIWGVWNSNVCGHVSCNPGCWGPWAQEEGGGRM